MSFSAEVKDEICRIDGINACCSRSELVAIIFTTGLSSEVKEVRSITESSAFARRMYTLLKKHDAKMPEVEVKKSERLRGHTYYCVKCKESPFDLVDMDKVMSKIKSSDCCKYAFLRGAFLAVGSISNPGKMYHLELDVSDFKAAEFTASLMKSIGLKPRIVERKKSFVIYPKEGEDLVDFLNITGAHNALLQIENIRILKDMRNNVNRIVNCETANLGKTLDASFRQLEDINLIKKKMGFNKLPESLKSIAQLRLENKEANLKELGEMLEPPIGKSGVNHRLKKLEKIAEKIRDMKGE